MFDLLILLYRFLIFPLGLFLFWVLSFFHPKVKEGWKLRKGSPWLNKKLEGEVIWFHCSSGEIEYAKSIIRELKSRKPDVKVLITYFSPSIIGNLKKEREIDFFCPLPWDSPFYLKNFIQHHKPTKLMISRTDLWPELLAQCRKYNVTTILFSATFSGEENFFAKTLYSILLPKLNKIFLVSKEDQLALQKITDVPAHVAGDTRYEQCLFRLGQTPGLKDNLKPEGFTNPTLIAGSTWREDEGVLVNTFSQLINQLNLIVVPHEPSESHILALEEAFKEISVPCKKYSLAESWSEGEVLIVDQVGVLAPLYRWADYAFVGGSFNGSVHSVMEPLACGLLTFVGPDHKNNREAQEFQNIGFGEPTISAVQCVKNAEDMIAKVDELGCDWTPTHRSMLAQEFQSRAKVSKTIVDQI